MYSDVAKKFKQTLLLLLWTVFWISATKATGEKAFDACRSYGQSMLECHNVLYPNLKVRVPIDFLQYPHMVLIGFRNNKEEEPAWKCGGTLISNKWVLTAAHCVEDPSTGPASIMRVGTATFEFDEADLEQERDIAEIVSHPEYKPPSKYNDIALMRADPVFIVSRDIRIACLQLKDEFDLSLNLSAIGFGVTAAGDRFGSQTLMKVDVDLVNTTACNRSMKALIKKKILSSGITEGQICAGDYDHGGRDTCQGDSGGPLQVMNEKVDCITSFPLHTVVGVTSFGRDCGRKWAPGVYTKVSRYIEWIESVVWP